jgi:hypothetical protein
MIYTVFPYRGKEAVIMGEKLFRAGKRGAVLGLALLAGLAVPLLILAAVVQGVRYLYLEWRSIRAGLLAGNLSCSLDTDCPPGYVCYGGRCVPNGAR